MEVYERRHTKIANALRCLSGAGSRLRNFEAPGFMHLLGEVRNISKIWSFHDRAREALLGLVEEGNKQNSHYAGILHPYEGQATDWFGCQVWRTDPVVVRIEYQMAVPKDLTSTQAI